MGGVIATGIGDRLPPIELYDVDAKPGALDDLDDLVDTQWRSRRCATTAACRASLPSFEEARPRLEAPGFAIIDRNRMVRFLHRGHTLGDDYPTIRGARRRPGARRRGRVTPHGSIRVSGW